MTDSGQVQIYAPNLILYMYNHHSHAISNHTSNTLFIPIVNSYSGVRTFQVRSGHLWNSLAPTIRTDLNSMSIS